jgi:hypothetical protein
MMAVVSLIYDTRVSTLFFRRIENMTPEGMQPNRDEPFNPKNLSIPRNHPREAALGQYLGQFSTSETVAIARFLKKRGLREPLLSDICNDLADW